MKNKIDYPHIIPQLGNYSKKKDPTTRLSEIKRVNSLILNGLLIGILVELI